ncbi:hypothetical protein QTO34_014395, partial [Cnephaeus nilssonii]
MILRRRPGLASLHPGFVRKDIQNESEDMEKENSTLLTEFILTGLIYQPEWQIPLFLVFLVIYLITMVGNLGLIALICNDSHLHTPMYLLLGSLAFVDAWIASTVTPKMLVIILTKILKKKSLQGIRKAFSTCGAHLLSVSLYFGSLLFMYVRPGSAQADGQNMMDSLFYTVIIPLLNPIIYSLRNKKVLDSLTKIIAMAQTLSSSCRWQCELSVPPAQSATPATPSPAPLRLLANRGHSKGT